MKQKQQEKSNVFTNEYIDYKGDSFDYDKISKFLSKLISIGAIRYQYKVDYILMSFDYYAQLINGVLYDSKGFLHGYTIKNDSFLLLHGIPIIPSRDIDPFFTPSPELPLKSFKIKYCLSEQVTKEQEKYVEDFLKSEEPLFITRGDIFTN